MSCAVELEPGWPWCGDGYWWIVSTCRSTQRLHTTTEYCSRHSKARGGTGSRAVEAHSCYSCTTVKRRSSEQRSSSSGGVGSPSCSWPR
eukprot:4514488-Prymnesium_polylepis.2